MSLHLLARRVECLQLAYKRLLTCYNSPVFELPDEGRFVFAAPGMAEADVSGVAPVYFGHLSNCSMTTQLCDTNLIYDIQNRIAKAMTEKSTGVRLAKRVWYGESRRTSLLEKSLLSLRPNGVTTLS